MICELDNVIGSVTWKGYDWVELLVNPTCAKGSGIIFLTSGEQYPLKKRKWKDM